MKDLTTSWKILGNLTTDIRMPSFNTLRPRQHIHHFPDDIFKCIFLNENAWSSIKISLKFVPRGPNNNIPALVQIMAWHLPGDKPLSEPVMVNLLMHICVTQPQWVKLKLLSWHINLKINKMLRNLAIFLGNLVLKILLPLANFLLPTEIKPIKPWHAGVKMPVPQFSYNLM